MVSMSLLARVLSESSRRPLHTIHSDQSAFSLREHSHGKDMTYITNTAIEVINFVKSKGIEIRFSSEDSFRSGESAFLMFAFNMH
jgi:isopropylmalate/homocitrate/citramalate synthase